MLFIMSSKDIDAPFFFNILAISHESEIQFNRLQNGVLPMWVGGGGYVLIPFSLKM